MKVPKTINTIKSDKLTWINVTRPGKNEVKYLQDKFNFFALDLKDCMPPLQRPRIQQREEYIFMILNFPLYDIKTKKITSVEVDFFITKDLLITVHDNTLKPLQSIYEGISQNIQYKKEIFTNTGNLVYQILDDLVESVFPMLNDISLDIETIEDTVTKTDKPESIEKILITKRNIANFRKIMLAHKATIRKLLMAAPNFFPVQRLKKFFNNLVDQTKDVWDTLENYKETIDALHETKESIYSYRLNDIMKILTIFSVVVFPLTLLAAIFGMNTTVGMPFIESKYGFWFVLGIMLVGTIFMFIFFKKKKWL